MDDEERQEVDDERVAEGTRTVAAALGEYAESWDDTEGGVVIGFVALLEVACPDGEVRFVEVAGFGDGGEDELPPWRRAGYLHAALAGWM